ncbi:MAG: sigma-70 family RNA polymerase sigma factor [bacterium]
MAISGKRDSYTALDDEHLAAMMQQGDMRAFETLVERHRQRAYYLALGLVGDRDDAADLSQEAFVRVYRAARRFDTTKDFFTWVYVIIANLARNWHKKRQVRSTFSRAEQADQESIRSRQERDNPEILLQTDETKAQVWRAIEALPFKFREIIILRHIEELPYEEIASLLEIPLGSVMSRLYYARRKLRQILEGEDV